MDEEIERLVVSVRADTAGFAKDVADMRATLEGPFAEGAQRAGRVVETALLRAVRTGKFGFEDLKKVALGVLAEIAAAAVRSGIDAIGDGRRGGGGSGLIGALAGVLSGVAGRATGGPVSPGVPYLVGERGPELFVPTAAGRVETGGARGGRDVRVAITVNARSGEAPAALARSSRQVARAVKAALAGVE